MGTKALVIGGTGNISTSIVNELLERGHDVSVFVRGERKDDLPDDVRRMHGDRYHPAFADQMRAHEFDVVYDMVSYEAGHAETAVRAFRGNVGHFVHCSTVVVYGVNFREMPVTEEHPRSASDPYGANKARAEDVLIAAYREHQFPVTILRPSHTYGRMPLVRQLTAADSRFLDRLRKGRPIVVVDTADRTLWSALHADDAALAFVGVVGRTHTIGEAYNVVGDDLYTWANYHRRVAQALGLDIELVPVPLRRVIERGGDEVRPCRDITAYPGWFSNEKIRRDVPEFRQRIGLEEGTRRACEFIEGHGMIADSGGMVWEDDLVAETTARF